MKVVIEKSNKAVLLSKSFSSAAELLSELKISKDTVLVVRNGEVILLDEPVGESDEVVLLSVVSGG